MLCFSVQKVLYLAASARFLLFWIHMENTVAEKKIARVQSQTCPICKTTLEVDPRYPTWCECGWNLRPQQAQARNFFEKIYSRESFPALYTLVDRVAESLESPRVDGVVIAGEYTMQRVSR